MCIAEHPPASIRFSCPNCGTTVREYIAELPNYDPFSDGMENGGSCVKQDFTCHECHEVTAVEIYTTPIGLAADFELTTGSVEVENGPSYDTRDFEAEYEEYLKQNPSTDPYDVYLDTVREIEDVIADFGKLPYKSQAFNRMIFNQYFSMLEAYLSNKLSLATRNDAGAAIKLIIGNKDWKADKIEILEVATNKNAISTWVQKRLRDYIYHRFTAVDHLYMSAVGVSIFPDHDSKVTLMKLLPVRHDCTHRNGRDHDGNIREITDNTLEKLAGTVDAVIKHIERKLDVIPF